MIDHGSEVNHEGRFATDTKRTKTIRLRKPRCRTAVQLFAFVPFVNAGGLRGFVIGGALSNGD
jgi:hypothetical protein